MNKLLMHHFKAGLRDRARHGFFFYWTIQFLYSAMFATDVYLVPYYMEIGYTNSQIGIVMALNSATSILFPPIFGILADKMRSKRKTLALCLTAMAIGALLIPMTSKLFWLCAVVVALRSGFGSPVSSLGETWTLMETEYANKQGSRITYGSIRAGASLGYALLCLTYSLLLQNTSLPTTFTFYAAVVFILPCVVMCLMGKKREHDFSGASKEHRPHYTFKQLHPSRLFKNYYYVIFLIVYAMMNCALTFGGNYISQLIVSVGGDTSFTGVLNFIRAFLEIPIFFAAPLFTRRYGHKKLLTASCTLFALANLLYIVQQNLTFIVAAQVLLGLSGGLMFASAIAYIYELVPRSLSSTAQTFSAGCNSIVITLSNLAGGFLIDNAGILSVFIICAIVSVAALLLFLGSLWLGKKKGIPFYNPETDPIEQQFMA